MVIEKAKTYFMGKEKYNCAQAILVAFHDNCDIDTEEIQHVVKNYNKKGHGRAEEGRCGALYAGMELIKDPEKKKKYEEKFAELAGSVKCKDIKKKYKTTCPECVEIGAKLLKQAINCKNVKEFCKES